MISSVNLPLGFKIPKFKKYDRYDDPITHFRCYYNQLRGAGGKEELSMAYVGESLAGLSSKWFADKDIVKWNSCDDMVNGFVQQFQYNIDFFPNEKSLTNMTKKNVKTFREYDIRWREEATRVKPPMKASKMVEVFIQAQDET
ncbi:putative cell differentiation protein RCD1 -like protein [Capsicum annuum]|uniref:Retrotransposon gag domain-containing protein n=1 Tax=Capsicum annuum TaxID=4072 RepID=A0A2G2ZX34_CAPAN|nr:putative cell differentiation protein RCD1 -like protein [Capsicum annuum]PHT86528.1 hypothetical protein T459_08634 [Capsicum annuum]